MMVYISGLIIFFSAVLLVCRDKRLLCQDGARTSVRCGDKSSIHSVVAY